MTSSRATLARSCSIASFVVCVAVATPAAAQRTAQDIESARQLYNQGMTLRDAGDMKGALDKFRAAHALGNTPLTGIELCRHYAALKQPVEAREVCLGIGRIPLLPQETQRSQEARAEAARIAEAEKPKMGTVRVRLTGLPPNAEPLVLVDGAAIPPAALGEARAVNPGAHVITAKVGDGPETRATIDTREGETRDVELAVVAPATPGPAPTGSDGRPRPGAVTPAPGTEKKNTLATVSFAIAGVSAGIGLISGLKAISAESDLDKNCIARQCGQELHSDLDSAQTWGNVSTAFFVIAGVALGVGVVSTVASSRTAKATTVTPVIGLGGAGLRGTF